MKNITTILDTLLGLLVVFAIPFAWIIRDGLGPDSIETAGVAAISQTFWTFYIGPLVLFTLLLRITFIFLEQPKAS